MGGLVCEADGRFVEDGVEGDILFEPIGDYDTEDV